MMKYFFTLLCASLALNIFAGVPRLSRSNLQQTSIIAGHLPDTSSVSGAEPMRFQQQFMRESHLTLNDNRFTAKSPRSWSVEELTGAKIAVADAYNFEWNDSTDKPEIIETDYAMMGMDCRLKSCGNQGYMMISGMYGDFAFPILIDLASGAVTIEAGKAIATLSNTAYPNSPNSNSGVIRMVIYHTQNWTIKKWTLYAMPLSRLLGVDNSDTIHGQVNEDGTISFNDDFAFLVCQETEGEDACTWSLSPIFRNLTLLNPNGLHMFEYTRTIFEEIPDNDQDEFGHGGLVPSPNKPNKPGSSKPVHGLAPSTLRGTGIDDNLKQETGGGGAMDRGSSRVPHLKPETVTSTEVRPVYMYQSDDSTLIVYNLFGFGNRCYLKINSDGTIELPRQQVYNDGLGKIYYSDNSCSATYSHDSIMWGNITLDNGIFWREQFDSNFLLLTGTSIDFKVPQDPILSYEEHDTSVDFYATTDESDGIEVVLYIYDEGSGEYFEVENPMFVPRDNDPYWIHLAAVAYNPNTFVPSDFVYLEYEIPALDCPIYYIRGDVNNDRAVNISDVTALINHLLMQDFNDSYNFNSENTDCNLDGEWTIADVTALFHYLLRGEW